MFLALGMNVLACPPKHEVSVDYAVGTRGFKRDVAQSMQRQGSRIFLALVGSTNGTREFEDRSVRSVGLSTDLEFNWAIPESLVTS
jgi:hypothetical protein